MKLQSEDYILVGLQGFLFSAYIFNITLIDIIISGALRKTGLVISIIGVLVFIISLLQLNKNLSPFPTPKSNSLLIQSGLYKYIRHPIYTGILLSFGGYSFYSVSLYRMIITILLLLLFIIKSAYEEKKLIEKFSGYHTYKAKTGRFFPKLFKP